MTTNKSPWSVMGWIFSVLIIIALFGITLLVIFMEEIAEERWILPNVAKSYFPFLFAWQKSSGNEFTGDATALLFGMASVPVAIDLISKSVVRYTPVSEKLKRVHPECKQ